GTSNRANRYRSTGACPSRRITSAPDGSSLLLVGDEMWSAIHTRSGSSVLFGHSKLREQAPHGGGARCTIFVICAEATDQPAGARAGVGCSWVPEYGIGPCARQRRRPNRALARSRRPLLRRRAECRHGRR